MFAPKTATPTSSSSASGTAVVACCGGVRSTERTVSLTQADRQSTATARPKKPALRRIEPIQRLLTGFVATVFLPELLFENRVRFVHRGFAQLPRYYVVVAGVGHVGRDARDVGILLRRHRWGGYRARVAGTSRAAGVWLSAVATAGTSARA